MGALSFVLSLGREKRGGNPGLCSLFVMRSYCILRLVPRGLCACIECFCAAV